MSDTSSTTLEEISLPIITPDITTHSTQETTPVQEPTLTQETTSVQEPTLPTNIEETNVVILTFSDLVKKSIENEVGNDKMKIKVTPEVKNVLNNMITLSPNTLNDIEKAVTDIIKDDKIDSNDIPNLIVVIQRIYQFIYSLKKVKFDVKKRAEITSVSLKYIIHLLVLLDKIKISEDKKEQFLSQSDALVDSCSNLLSFSKSIKTPSCFKKNKYIR